MLKVKRLVSELMTSKCYVVYDNDKNTNWCDVINLGSEKSIQEDDISHSILLIILFHAYHTDYLKLRE